MSINAELTYTVKGESAACAGHCNNLSHSGIQFETGKHLKEGTSLEIIIDTKSDIFKPMHAAVEVLRVELLDNNAYRIAGKILEYRQ